MTPSLSTVLLLTLFFQSVMLPALASSKKDDAPDSTKYNFLYFGSTVGGSHYLTLSRSGRVLVQRGHRVVSLVGSSNSVRSWQRDADVFSFVVFNSSYTKQNRTDVMDNVSGVIAKGHLDHFFGPFLNSANLTGRLSAVRMLLQECDDLLGDSTAMRRLREENFDMLVADEMAPCGPLLAQALDVPFVHNSVFFVIPAKHGRWTGLPIDPSYIPERVTGLTDKMTFLQRVQNVLAHHFYGFVHFNLNGICDFRDYDKLKVKYNISPEMSTLESHKQAVLYLMHGTFALQFARPMQPNTVLVLHHTGERSSNQTLDREVAQFLDTASSGVALFSMGTFVTMMEREQVQKFADAFAMLTHRVLWQTSIDLSGIRLGDNIMVAKWLPMTQVMKHPNVQVYVGQGGALTINEALWAGLPFVGIPLIEDQMDNLVRIETKGAGLKVDIASMTPGTLSQAIGRVMTEPKFGENARRISAIMRDLEPSDSPVDTVANWILHVTRFGGEHLRPAVQDLTFVQRNLLDVYLFLAALLALATWVNLTVCRFCLRCICRRGRNTNHLKRE